MVKNHLTILYQILAKKIYLSFAVSGLFIFTCDANPSNLYPVTWTPNVTRMVKETTGVDLKSKNDFYNVLYHKDVSEVDYVKVDFNDNLPTDKEPQAIAKTCQDYFRLTKAGFSPTTNLDIAAESWFIGVCDTLSPLDSAQAAKVSFIRDLDLRTAYPLFTPLIGDDKNWILASGNKENIVLKGKDDGGECNIAIAGWGDIYHDGYDDVILTINSYAGGGGSGHYYATSIISKHTKEGAFIFKGEKNICPFGVG